MERQMRCEDCGAARLNLHKKPYHYTESGIPDVYLHNVRWGICPKCKGRTVEIPRPAQLHRCIAWMIVMKRSFLTGPEMVFLRKILGKRQNEMAEVLGVGLVALNRWEKQTRRAHTKAADTLFRLAYLTLQDDEYTHRISQKIREDLMKYFGKIKSSDPMPGKTEVDAAACSPEKIIEETLHHPVHTTNSASCQECRP